MKSVIVGAGKYGEVYLSYFQESGIDVIGFLDDDPKLQGADILGVPILGGFSLMPELREKYGVDTIYCPLGNNKLRVKVLMDADAMGYMTPNFIHPSVLISPNVTIGDKGVYILPGTVIMPWTTIHDYAMISISCKVAHHSELDEGTFLSLGVNFGASIHAHKNAFCGIGSTVMTGVHDLGEDCLIGAGSVVIRDVPAGQKVAGVPAKCI